MLARLEAPMGLYVQTRHKEGSHLTTNLTWIPLTTTTTTCTLRKNKHLFLLLNVSPILMSIIHCFLMHYPATRETRVMRYVTIVTVCVLGNTSDGV